MEWNGRSRFRRACRRRDRPKSIPNFDPLRRALPPHLGDPTDPITHSPYDCTVTEVCDRFGGTKDRKRILSGFLDVREELRALGLDGFQWLDGSFVEDIEALEQRAPRDLDVVTFVTRPAAPLDLFAALRQRGGLMLRYEEVLRKSHVDH